MRTGTVLATLVALGLAGYALGDEPYTMSDPLRWVRSGGPVMSPVTMIGTTTRWARATSGGTTPLCVAWDTQVALMAAGEMTCAWTMSTTVTLGAQDAYTASSLVDDYGIDGDAAAVYIPAAGAVDSIPQIATLSQAPGRRPGVCTGPISYGRNLKLTYPPCRVDGDCADGGGSGTCNTSPTDYQRLQSCAFLVCRASSASTQLTVQVQR